MVALKDAAPRAIQLSEYAPPPFLIEQTDLRFELDPERTRVSSRLQMRRNAGTGENAGLRLDGQHQELLEVRLDGRVLNSNEYQVDEDSLFIADVPAQFILECTTVINPAANTALEGLYQSGGMYCTQCEAEGFRRITYYLDRPDVMSRFTTEIIADASKLPIMLSNGNEVLREQMDNGLTRVKWQDPFPKPSYLFALVAGDLALLEDMFVTGSGREVTLRIYSEPHNIDQCHFAMDALKRSMRWDEERYGREYDLDIFMIVAVDDFNMGAMENKGLNVFNTSCVLASPETTTDAGYQRVEAVVAHEYFHNWSGNRVTCRDWFQLSLKEGFTVFRDAQFSAAMGSETVKRIEDVNFLRSFQFPEDAGPMAHPVRPDSYIEINNFYTVTVYEKGAEVVRMLHTLLGEDGFRAGSDLYFERHDGQAVTTEDFVQAMEAANGIALTQFRRWYEQAGTPVLSVEQEWLEEEGILELRFSQQCPPTPGQSAKLPMHLPVMMGLVDQRGGALQAGEDYQFAPGPLDSVRSDSFLLNVTEQTQSVRFSGLAQRPVASLLRSFSAPVRLSFERASEELLTLSRFEPNGFARWDAMQTYMQRLLVADLVDDATRDQNAINEAREALCVLVSELQEQALTAPNDGEAKAVLAAMLALPEETQVGDLLSIYDVDGVHRVREDLHEHLAQLNAKGWKAVYDANVSDAPYAPDGPSIARRSLKNLALSYLVQSEGLEPALLQYERADNMTDRLAALRLVVDAPEVSEVSEVSEPDVKERLLQDFLQRFERFPLVVDQWFSLQASSPVLGTAAHVGALLNHELFEIRNPNKVRALIGAFSMRNPVQFHQRDGSGYDFLADRLEQLDVLNPQMAARLAQPLTRLGRYDAERAQMMRRVLQRLGDRTDVSPDMFEVVTKTLA